jgi:hypothetical protein
LGPRIAQQPPHSRQKAAQPELSQDRLFGSPDQIRGSVVFVVSQEGSSLFCWLVNALVATEEQAGEEAVKPTDAGVGAFSIEKAGTTVARTSRTRTVTKVFIVYLLGGWRKSPPHSSA